MSGALQMLAIVAPVFALILLGKGAVHYKFVDATGMRGLNDFVFMLAIPALLFGSVAETDALSVINVATSYFAACFLVYALALPLAFWLFRARLPRAAMFGLNACYGNTVMMGVPVITAGFGPAGVPYLLAIIAFHSALLLPLASVLVDAGVHGNADIRLLARTLWRGLSRNPIILSIFAAFAWRILALPVPDALHRLLAMLGAAAPPLALFCLGASLPRLTGLSVLAEASATAVLKLVVLPAVVWLAGRAMGIGGLPLAVSVVTAGMPTGANAFLLARRSAGLADASAGSVVLTTLLSIASLTVLLLWAR